MLTAPPNPFSFWNPFLNVRPATLVPFAGLLAVVLVGCRPSPQVEHYSVKKQRVLETENGGDPVRMLAAIVPYGKALWFFKVAGPVELVAKQSQAFDSFIKSLHFVEPDDGPPLWSLPDGWKHLPGNEMRFATLEIETPDRPLELSVSALPRPQRDDGVLANINRWRGQLGLVAIEREQMDDVTTTVELADGRAIIVNFEGRQTPGGMGQPPFAGGPMAGPPPSGPGAPLRHASGAEDQGPSGVGAEPTYQVPSEWEETGAGPMRKAGFRVTNHGLKAEIAISTAGGALLDNVNRWRGQVSLGPIDEEQLNDAARRITVDGGPGAYFQLVGTTKTILGVVTESGGQIWFIKLSGDSELAQRERERFETFVQSINFSGKEGAGDGH